MNYLKLVKETKRLIEEKLDNIHEFEMIEERYILNLFKKDDMEITFHALNAVCDKNVNIRWHKFYGDSYEDEQQTVANFVYNRILESDWFTESLDDAISNYWYDEANV